MDGMTDELKAALRDLTALMETNRREVKGSALALCLARLSAVIEDDDAPVPPEAFAELNADGRKLALAGLMLLVNQAFSE
jgi:hypothetical protein